MNRYESRYITQWQSAEYMRASFSLTFLVFHVHRSPPQGVSSFPNLAHNFIEFLL
jgi:hypothetical protein